MANAAAVPLTKPSSGMLPWAAVGVALLGVVVIYGSTFRSLVSVWLESDTFAHCFLIAPVSAWLIYRRRGDLARAPKRPSVLGLTAVLVLGLCWFVAATVNVQVGQQLCAVLLIPAVILALIGVDATKLIAFPLAYLLFAVPFGEVLIPVLMEWTAAFCVAALRISGIPVLREGLYFSIPAGDFEVAKACSGIRYLIACLALGTLYSYLSYTSWRKRLLFIVVSCVAPIVANGVRAYLIVMIAHWSSMQLAVGSDHLIYGWIFFGALVALMFWIGGFFQDVMPASATHGADQTTPSSGPLRFAGATVVAIAVAAAGPYWFDANAKELPARAAASTLPRLTGAWQGPRPAEQAWLLPPPGRPTELRAVYGGDAGAVELDVLVYGVQGPGGEMVGAVDALWDRSRWQVLEAGTGPELEPGFAPREVIARRGGSFRVVWFWYVVGAERATRDWSAKWLEARTALRGGGHSALVLVSAEGPDPERARAALRGFTGHALRGIETCLQSIADSCVAAD